MEKKRIGIIIAFYSFGVLVGGVGASMLTEIADVIRINCNIWLKIAYLSASIAFMAIGVGLLKIGFKKEKENDGSGID